MVWEHLAHINLYSDTNCYALSGSQLHILRLLPKTAADKIVSRPFLKLEYQKSRQCYLKINWDLACSLVGSSHISKEQEGINTVSLQAGRQVATLHSIPASATQGGRRGGCLDGWNKEERNQGWNCTAMWMGNGWCLGQRLPQGIAPGYDQSC